MPKFSDSDGFFWTDPTESLKKYKGAPVTSLPETDWEPPSEYPNLSGAKRLGFDIETCDPDLTRKGPGVRRSGNYVCGYSLSTGDESWYFPIRHVGGGNMDVDATLGYLRETIGSFTGDIYGANLQYDLDWGMEEGICFDNVRRFIDVTLAEPLLNENLFEYNLDAILTRRYGDTGGKVEDTLRKAASYYEYDDPKASLHQLHSRFVGEYAEADAFKPINVYDDHLAKELASQDLTDLFDMECRLIPLLVAMRRRGVRVASDDRIESVRNFIAGHREKLIEKINDAAGFEVSLNDAGGTLTAAFDKLGIAYPVTPKTEKPSFVKNWLEEHDHWFPKIVADARKWEKMEGTFIAGHLGHAINGRIHCEFNQLRGNGRGTISGRFSSTNPNLQNIPSRDEEIAPMIRSLFLPDEGEKWWQFDWSQIEYRLLAHYARGRSGKRLRAQFNADPTIDFHRLCGDMAGLDGSDPYIRKRVKNVNFGVVYGAGGATTAATMGVSLEEGKRFLNKYHEHLPFASKTFEAAMNKAKDNGWIFTLLKRRARFPLWEPKGYSAGRKKRTVKALPRNLAVQEWGEHGIQRAYTYSSLNRLLQGSAADLMKQAMVDIWESGVCNIIGSPALTVHDDLNWSAPDTSESLDALREVKHIMENCIKLSVPILADVECGDDWGHLSEVTL